MTLRSNVGGSYGIVQPVNVDAEAEFGAFDTLPQPLRERLNRASVKILAATVMPAYRRQLDRGFSEAEAVARIIRAIDDTERAVVAPKSD